MQAGEKLAGSFCLSQFFAVFLVISNRYLAQLGQELILACGQEADLKLAKIAQRLGGFPSADAALMAAQAPKQALELEVVGRQTRDLKAVEEILAKQFPTIVQPTVEGTRGLPGCGHLRRIPAAVETGQI